MASGVYLIFGDDEYLAATKAGEVVSSHVAPEDQALGLEIVNGAAGTVEEATHAVAGCMSAILTPGLFAGAKVVWFRDVSFLTDTPVGKSEAVRTGLNRLAEVIKQGLPPATTLVVSAGRVDKRYAFYKACADGGDLHEFSVPQKGRQADRMAAERLRTLAGERKMRMTDDVCEAFLERVGNDTRRLVCEIDKLAVFLGERNQATIDDVRTIISSSRETPAWDLADAFGRRQLPRSLEILRQLLFQKESPIGLVITIESRIRDLMLYKEALQRGWLKDKGGRGGGQGATWGDVPPEAADIFADEFERDPRSTHPYRAGLLAAQAKGFSRTELRKCHQLALAAHEQLVSSRIPHAVALELMLVSMLS